METMRYAVRAAILIAAGIFAAEYFTVEKVSYTGATFQQGAFYAPGRMPNDGRSK